MKKLILSALACIAIVISSCNQNSPAPSPATPTPTPTPTPTLAVLTHQDSLLLGNWILDKKEMIMNGTMMPNYPQLFNDPVNAKIEFKAALFQGTNNQNWKECNDGITNTGYVIANWWKLLTNTTVSINTSVYSINLINSTNLVLQNGSVNSPGTAGYIYYLHK
jgi:hypothetical protein